MSRAYGFFLLSLLSVGCRSSSSKPVDQAPLPSAAPLSQKAAAPPPFRRTVLPRIDFHTHVILGAGLRAVRLFQSYGIVHAINLSGPPPGRGLDDFIADGEIAYGRLSVFTNLNWVHCRRPGYGQRMAQDLVQAKSLGAKGLKIPKALGLDVPGPDGRLLTVDDPGLDPVFDKAGQLGLPVAIHIGDPKVFWDAPGESNERHDELDAHPEWSFYEDAKAGRIPSWQALFDAFVRRVGRHKKTTFVGVHFGNDPEDPATVARVLDANPNLWIDIAARVPAIGRRDQAHDAAFMRAFFIKYQDRILFGTDTGVGRGPTDLMFGSTGKAPPGPEDADRFFNGIYRYLETNDRDIPTPTPIQGRWNVDGIGLPREVLEKIYFKNAVRLLGIKLPDTLLPKPEPLPSPNP